MRSPATPCEDQLVQSDVPARARCGGFHSQRPLRLIQVFNRYRFAGGEENSVARIAAHLESAGHEVNRFWRASQEWLAPGAPPKWRQLLLTWKNAAVLDELRRVHLETRADAWLCHNVVPVISLGVYRLARELNVPVIHWLHNYRPLSPSGSLRAGKKNLQPHDPFLVWKEILSGAWHGRFLTAWLALGFARLKWRGDFESVKAWIAVSEEMKRIFEQANFPREKLFLLRHSWDAQPRACANSDKGYFLFLGRMVEEKGANFLIELWQRPEFRDTRLVMAGEGPLAEYFRDRTPPNVSWVGFVQGEEKRRLVAGCRAVLFPCLWAEPLSTVIYEAYEQARPVLASNMGGLKEIIADGVTGRLLEAGNQSVWAAAIQEFVRDPEASRAMGEQGLQWLNANVSPVGWNRQFDEIIARALPARRDCGRENC